MQNTTPELQKYLKSECKSGGVYVNAIIPKSPVSKTKLRKGDIICRINDIKIDFSGDLNKKWMNENMSFQNLLAEIGINNLVKIEYWNGTKMVSETFKLNSFVTTVRTWYPVIEKIDYECFGGLIIMNVNKNVLEHIPNFRLLHLLDISNIMNESVIITNILVGGQVSKMNILSKGDIICKVNDEKIKTLSDFRKHFMKYKTYVKIETTKNKMVILPMKMLLQDDKSLIKTYNYKQSNVFKKVK
jgi:membrane-associated protease RseP (regulator of RpoE activity)